MITSVARRPRKVPNYMISLTDWSNYITTHMDVYFWHFTPSIAASSLIMVLLSMIQQCHNLIEITIYCRNASVSYCPLFWILHLCSEWAEQLRKSTLHCCIWALLTFQRMELPTRLLIAYQLLVWPVASSVPHRIYCQPIHYHKKNDNTLETKFLHA